MKSIRFLCVALMIKCLLKTFKNLLISSWILELIRKTKSILMTIENSFLPSKFL